MGVVKWTYRKGKVYPSSSTITILVKPLGAVCIGWFPLDPKESKYHFHSNNIIKFETVGSYIQFHQEVAHKMVSSNAVVFVYNVMYLKKEFTLNPYLVRITICQLWRIWSLFVHIKMERPKRLVVSLQHLYNNQAQSFMPIFHGRIMKRDRPLVLHS